MKKKIFLFVLILFYFILLFDSKTVFLGAKKGLILWFDTIIPTLFPFIILCQLIPIFLPSCCLLGLLSGYPLGAVLIKESYLTTLQENQINSYEQTHLQLLLGFVNIISPIFLSNYVCTTCFPWKEKRFILLTSLYLGTFFCYIFFCFLKRKDHPKHSFSLYRNQSIQNFSLNTIFLTSASNLIIFGGFIMLSAILIEFIQKLTYLTPIIRAFLSCFIEFSNGFYLLGQLYRSNQISYFITITIVLFFSSFGCISIFFQTFSVLHQTKLSIKAYILQKFICGFFSLIIFFILEFASF